MSLNKRRNCSDVLVPTVLLFKRSFIQQQLPLFFFLVSPAAAGSSMVKRWVLQSGNDGTQPIVGSGPAAGAGESRCVASCPQFSPDRTCALVGSFAVRESCCLALKPRFLAPEAKNGAKVALKVQHTRKLVGSGLV